MKTSVEKLEGTNVKLSVTVPAEDVDKAIDGVYSSVANQVKIPGFRKGKAPRPVIDSHVGRDYILTEATEEIVNSTYSRAVDAEGLRPIESPEISDLEPVKPGEEFTYVAEVETRPELTLSSYQGISVELPPSTASDREIDAQIEYMAERFATLEPVTERGVQVEDFVLLSFVGKVDGEDYDGNTVDKYLYEMSRGLMPVEFDAGLIGVEAGAERHIEFPIPESTSQPDYVGRIASFDVTVHEIKAKVLPPIDDEFAGNVGGFDSVEDLRADLREKMDAQKGVAQMQLKEREVRSAVAANLEGDIPEALVRSRSGAMLRDFMTGLETRDTTFENYVQATGVSPDKIQADIEAQALESVREELALEALYRALDLDVTDDDIDEELRLVSGEGEGEGESEGESSAEDLRKRWEEAGVMTAVREQIMQKKAVLWLLDNVKVTEKPDAFGGGEADAAESKAEAPKKPAKKRASKKKTAEASDTEPTAESDAADVPAEAAAAPAEASDETTEE